MKLIVGLGNPGKNYHNTRHNIGFMFLDEIANRENLKFKLDTKLKCELTELKINNEKVILIKPQTYMNLSGQSVYAVCKYYNINLEDILVIQDDLDLELGKLRFRAKGTSGGHKGIQNIIDQKTKSAALTPVPWQWKHAAAVRRKADKDRHLPYLPVQTASKAFLPVPLLLFWRSCPQSSVHP